MSNMAAEMANRMREDGIEPSGPGTQVPMVDVPPTVAPGTPSIEAPAPGNVGVAPVPPPAPVPSAGTQNAETVIGDTDPGPVPYSRFKEVNDRYAQVRGYEELAQFGYDPDSLGRLAAFEAGYIRDPVGTIGALVDELDLPQEAKASVKEALGTPSPPGPSGVNGDEGDGTSSLSTEDRELLDWARSAREKETNQAREAQLDSVVNIWKANDTKEKIASPDDIRILTEISAAAARGGFRTHEELAVAARDGYMAERERILGTAVQRNGRGTPPPALPEGGALPAPPQKFKSLADVNKVLKAALERGERLPDLDGR